MLAKDVQDLIHRAALLAARIELTIRVGARASLAKAIVRLAVHLMLAADQRNVFLSLTHILATLQDDGTQAQLDQSQGGEKPSRAGTNHDDGLPARHILVTDRFVFRLSGHFVDEQAQF